MQVKHMYIQTLLVVWFLDFLFKFPHVSEAMRHIDHKPEKLLLYKDDKQCPLEIDSPTEETCARDAKANQIECFAWSDVTSKCTVCLEGCSRQVISHVMFKTYLQPLSCPSIRALFPVVSRIQICPHPETDLNNKWTELPECRAQWCELSQFPERASNCDHLIGSAKHVHRRWNTFCRTLQSTSTPVPRWKEKKDSKTSLGTTQQPTNFRKTPKESDDTGLGVIVAGSLIVAAVACGCLGLFCTVVIKAQENTEDSEPKTTFVRSTSRTISGKLARSEEFIRNSVHKTKTSSTQVKALVLDAVRKFSQSSKDMADEGSGSRDWAKVNRSKLHQLSRDLSVRSRQLVPASRNFVRGAVRKLSGKLSQTKIAQQQVPVVATQRPDPVPLRASVVPVHAQPETQHSKPRGHHNGSVSSSRSAPSIHTGKPSHPSVVSAPRRSLPTHPVHR
eukprot:gnl/MRDRNA2_/MRDRNA2_117150_c0_seq1.p1 gnl/MRDRNA2_/MRDRNA2_117150_c0~~gnl/MRDRNA2_/MRDRNA2_117150_c0_seq1.p1  ORF type:complete len:447 (+),score=57.45 gnl/MRDRNA2_/MRDRNA2_117150_c0_seq1:129-1469(+)